MTQPTPPFAGAKLNPMLLIGMPSVDLHAAGYFDLAATQTVTYAATQKVTPQTLAEGDKLYRVYGGSGKAKAKGGFWAPAPPAATDTEGDWRSSNAVEPAWNDGTQLVELTVNPGCTLQTWTGEIESQPAMDDEGKMIKDWWLVGGGTQFFTQFWTPEFSASVTLTPMGNTPWSSTADVLFQMPDQTVTVDAKVNDLDLSREAHTHIALMSQLVDALRASGQRANDAEEAAKLMTSANTIARSANAMLADTEAKDGTLELAIRSNLNLARMIDIDPSEPNAADAIGALSAVVHNAAILSGRSQS